MSFSYFSQLNNKNYLKRGEVVGSKAEELPASAKVVADAEAQNIQNEELDALNELSIEETKRALSEKGLMYETNDAGQIIKYSDTAQGWEPYPGIAFDNFRLDGNGVLSYEEVDENGKVLFIQELHPDGKLFDVTDGKEFQTTFTLNRPLPISNPLDGMETASNITRQLNELAEDYNRFGEGVVTVKGNQLTINKEALIHAGARVFPRTDLTYTYTDNGLTLDGLPVDQTGSPVFILRNILDDNFKNIENSDYISKDNAESIVEDKASELGPKVVTTITSTAGPALIDRRSGNDIRIEWKNGKFYKDGEVFDIDTL
mgnify:CR=1 FL=1